MKRKTVLIILCLLVSAFFISCDKEESKDNTNDAFKIESKTAGEDFLTSLYTTTEDEILEFTKFAAGEEGAFDYYVAYLKGLYEGVLTQSLSDSLAADRYLDLVSQYAYVHETSFEVESVELTIFDEDDLDIVYEYTVKVKDEKSGIITDIFGQIRVQNIEGETLITATDLDNTGTLKEAYFR